MRNRLKTILEGMGRVLVLDPATDYVRPSKKDFKSDMDLLRKDARQVGIYLRTTVRRYGKVSDRQG